MNSLDQALTSPPPLSSSRSSWAASTGSHCLTPPAPSDWSIGTHLSPGSRWQFWRRPRPCPLDMDAHPQGLVCGEEQAIEQSLLQIACNARRHHWRVVWFDGLGSQLQAQRFATAMRTAIDPCQEEPARIHIFPNMAFDGFTGASQQVVGNLLQVLPEELHPLAMACLPPFHFSLPSLSARPTRLHTLVQHLSRQGAPIASHAHLNDFASMLLHYQVFANYAGKSLDGTWTFADTDAAYLRFDTLLFPDESAALARFLLGALLNREQDSPLPAQPPLLLIMRYPFFLFPPSFFPLLIAFMRERGSLFLASSRPLDFGFRARQLVEHADAILLHRGARPLQTAQGVSLSAKQLARLRDNECFLVQCSRVSHVALTSPALTPEDLEWTRQWMPFAREENAATLVPFFQEDPYEPPAPHRDSVKPGTGRGKRALRAASSRSSDALAPASNRGANTGEAETGSFALYNPYHPDPPYTTETEDSAPRPSTHNEE